MPEWVRRLHLFIDEVWAIPRKAALGLQTSRRFLSALRCVHEFSFPMGDLACREALSKGFAEMEATVQAVGTCPDLHWSAWNEGVGS